MITLSMPRSVPDDSTTSFELAQELALVAKEQNLRLPRSSTYFFYAGENFFGYNFYQLCRILPRHLPNYDNPLYWSLMIHFPNLDDKTITLGYYHNGDGKIKRLISFFNEDYAEAAGRLFKWVMENLWKCFEKEEEKNDEKVDKDMEYIEGLIAKLKSSSPEQQKNIAEDFLRSYGFYEKDKNGKEKLIDFSQ